MTVMTNAKSLRQYKGGFSLIVEKALVFPWSPNMIGELKNLSPNFKQIAWRRFASSNIAIRIVRSILSLNSEQFHPKLYADSLYIVDITFHFL